MCCKLFRRNAPVFGSTCEGTKRRTRPRQWKDSQHQSRLRQSVGASPSPRQQNEGEVEQLKKTSRPLTKELRQTQLAVVSEAFRPLSSRSNRVCVVTFLGTIIRDAALQVDAFVVKGGNDIRGSRNCEDHE